MVRHATELETIVNALLPLSLLHGGISCDCGRSTDWMIYWLFYFLPNTVNHRLNISVK